MVDAAVVRELSFALNDLLDSVETLTDMVEEINPGATEQLRHIRFLLDRAGRSLDKP